MQPCVHDSKSCTIRLPNDCLASDMKDDVLCKQAKQVNESS